MDDVIAYIAWIVAAYYGVKWMAMYVEQQIRTAPERAERRRVEREEYAACQGEAEVESTVQPALARA
jgi:hypothetical protein